MRNKSDKNYVPVFELLEKLNLKNEIISNEEVISFQKTIEQRINEIKYELNEYSISELLNSFEQCKKIISTAKKNYKNNNLKFSVIENHINYLEFMIFDEYQRREKTENISELEKTLFSAAFKSSNISSKIYNATEEMAAAGNKINKYYWSSHRKKLSPKKYNFKNNSNDEKYESNVFSKKFSEKIFMDICSDETRKIQNYRAKSPEDRIKIRTKDWESHDKQIDFTNLLIKNEKSIIKKDSKNIKVVQKNHEDNKKIETKIKHTMCVPENEKAVFRTEIDYQKKQSNKKEKSIIIDRKRKKLKINNVSNKNEDLNKKDNFKKKEIIFNKNEKTEVEKVNEAKLLETDSPENKVHYAKELIADKSEKENIVKHNYDQSKNKIYKKVKDDKEEFINHVIYKSVIQEDKSELMETQKSRGYQNDKEISENELENKKRPMNRNYYKAVISNDQDHLLD